jgi:hypothetical protein
MKYMLPIHQGTTPLPGSPEWEALSDEEKGKVCADRQAINDTPGMTPGVQMASPEDGDHGALQDDRTLTTDGPFVVSPRPTVRTAGRIRRSASLSCGHLRARMGGRRTPKLEPWRAADRGQERRKALGNQGLSE